MMRPAFLLCALALLVAQASAFLPLTPAQSRLPIAARSVPGRTHGVVQMGVVEAFNAYADIWSPTIKTIVADNGIPDIFLKWFHAANMGIVLATMVTFGTYLGWQIRGGNGEMTFTGKTARELHPTLMGLAFLFFFLGGQGGFVLLDVLDKPILESKHAITGALGIALLAVQALLPRFFSGEESGATLRTAHAYLGSAVVALLFVHAGLGIQLGLSL